VLSIAGSGQRDLPPSLQGVECHRRVRTGWPPQTILTQFWLNSTGIPWCRVDIRCNWLGFKKYIWSIKDYKHFKYIEHLPFISCQKQSRINNSFTTHLNACLPAHTLLKSLEIIEEFKYSNWDDVQGHTFISINNHLHISPSNLLCFSLTVTLYLFFFVTIKVTLSSNQCDEGISIGIPISKIQCEIGHLVRIHCYIYSLGDLPSMLNECFIIISWASLQSELWSLNGSWRRKALNIHEVHWTCKALNQITQKQTRIHWITTDLWQTCCAEN
jgi:hypothetical protein